MNVNGRLVVGQTVGLFVLFAVALFLPAGSIAWPAGWTFLVMFFAFFITVITVIAWLSRHNPGLLEERMHLGLPISKGGISRFFLCWKFSASRG